VSKKSVDDLGSKHWTDTLFVIYGTLSALVFGILFGQLVFGSISFLSLAGFCVAVVMGFLAGAGTKGALLVGTPPQLVAGSLLGAALIAATLWLAHSLTIVIAIASLHIPGELWVALSALTGFVGATRQDATKRGRPFAKDRA
jgi:hypothetical protein